MARPRYIPVREIDHFAGGKVIDLPIDPEQEARVTLVLRPRTPHHTMGKHLDRMALCLPHQRHYFTREEFAHQYGADGGGPLGDGGIRGQTQSRGG